MENSYLKLLKCLVSWVAFITVVVPILLPIFLIVFIFRTFIEIVAKIFRPDLVALLNSSEYISAIDKLYKRPFSNNVLLAFTKESLTLDQVQYGFSKNVLEKKTRGNQLEFSKLFLYPKEFCLYFFWKKVDFFDIKQYTKEITVKNQEEVDAFLAEWIVLPYGNGKSPWEIALIRILENDSTAIAMKIHSVLSCVYSFPQIFDALIQNQSQIDPNISKYNLWHHVNLFLMFPYILFQIYMQEILNHEYFSTTRYNSEMICSRVEIPTRQSKDMTKLHLDIFTSSLSRALRTFHTEEKCNKKNNNYLHSTVKFSSSSDPILMLLEAENDSEENKNNTKEINRKQVPLLSILPKRILRAIFGVPSASLITHNYMNYNFDKEKPYLLWGKPISQFYFINGLSRPNWGVTLSSTRSVNNTGCCIFASQDVIPNQDAANRIMHYFKDEINELLATY